MSRILALITILVMHLPTLFAQQAGEATPCLSAQQKQFDFWLGEWDLTWPGDKPGEVAHGSNSITRIMDGCVVQENFSAGESGHLRGTSVSVFDLKSGVWKQTWVDNEGGYLDFVGEYKDSKMILQREAVRGGAKILQRMVFKNISANQMDWSWEASSDGGKTWEVNWQIHYKRRT